MASKITRIMWLLSVLCVFFVQRTVSLERTAHLWTDQESRMFQQSFPGRCRRSPPGMVLPKSSGDNKFQIEISGHPDKYQPGELYTITLQGIRAQQIIHKFIGFMLIVEPKETRNDISSRPDVGSFQLFGDALSRFSEDCPNTIIQTSVIPKTEIQVMWKAPPTGTGCVVFKATVQENRDSWYMDERSLIRELCEEEQENRDDQPEIIVDCCACDEAKYELSFEGLWSRQTHPKDFPSYEWETYFSDIVGTSHKGDFRMWEYGEYASHGVKEVAEGGTTNTLESELKAESDKIRTIVKAQGLRYPNLNGKTFTIFRVDRLHHLVSFLTRLNPSPDWIVGVSALELCLKNCSWVSEKIMNLYPWDAGTNSGHTYISDKHPTFPQDKIRRITSSNPNTPRSPFYDPTGQPMRPVARLTVTRKKLYDKPCSDPHPTVMSLSADELNIPDRPTCRVTEWTEFTSCSVTCGHGVRIRSRHFLNPHKADMSGCFRRLVDKDICKSPCIGDESCSTKEWSEWFDCSVTCGKGLRTRSRKYLDIKSQEVCALEMMEKESCLGMEHGCDDPVSVPNPSCATTQWSEWSPCSVSCGKGQTFRTRMYIHQSALGKCNAELMQKSECTGEKSDCPIGSPIPRVVCNQPKEVGPCRGYFPRWYYDVERKICLHFIYGGCRGNPNNFEQYTDCNKTCDILRRVPLPKEELSTESPPAMDCLMTNWSDWTPCSQTCGNGKRERRRMIIANPLNGGKACPPKQVQKRRCKNNPPCY